jgi:hypothetical protein
MLLLFPIGYIKFTRHADKSMRRDKILLYSSVFMFVLNNKTFVKQATYLFIHAVRPETRYSDQYTAIQSAKSKVGRHLKGHPYFFRSFCHSYIDVLTDSELFSIMPVSTRGMWPYATFTLSWE